MGFLGSGGCARNVRSSRLRINIWPAVGCSAAPNSQHNSECSTMPDGQNEISPDIGLSLAHSFFIIVQRALSSVPVGLEDLFVGEVVNEPTTIFDLNEGKLFYDFPIALNERRLGSIRVAATKSVRHPGSRSSRLCRSIRPRSATGNRSARHRNARQRSIGIVAGVSFVSQRRTFLKNQGKEWK